MNNIYWVLVALGYVQVFCYIALWELFKREIASLRKDISQDLKEIKESIASLHIRVHECHDHARDAKHISKVNKLILKRLSNKYLTKDDSLKFIRRISDDS